MRSSRHAVLGPLLVVCLVLTACSAETGSVGDPMAQTVTGSTDAGAAARDAALDRYPTGEAAEPQELVIPDLVGMSAPRAARAATEAGFEVRLVPFDPESPITGQSPAYGQPAPLDGVIEIRQGQPPTEEPDAADEDIVASADSGSPQSAIPDQGDTISGEDGASPSGGADVAATAAAPTAAASAVQTTGAVSPSYVLPPHTEGRLRTNPRFLPALPLGTQLTGQASWYGPGFHGNTTACGGVYDQNGPTIAARELRCGTIVRITGPSGATVEATVTDWGPAEWTGRRFDLSAAVFNAIAPLGAGVIPVTVVTANVPG